ncbi:MAG TPA: Gfo/Idh/MocA family oxidoreductase [Burkholderiales bacterium]|nr:Gfo/Idh/MocA family oxidoreductase [Burkholderiales bacterium]
MTRHRIGIVGLGMALKPHALSLADLANRVEVAAAFAPSAGRREEAAKAWGLPVVDSLDRIMADRSIDTVLILTPPWTHTDLVNQAAVAGKHVLLEKPVEANAARATAIVEACERAGVRLAIVFQHRFRPAALELAKRVHGGKLGKLLSASATIRWWRSPEYFAQPGRGTLARDGGGVLLTQAIHTLDLLLHLVGPVQEVMAYVDTSPLRAIDTEDIVAGSVRYANGATGVIDATTVTYPGYPERIEIAGTAGSAVLEVETLTVNDMNGERFRLDGAAAGGGGADPMAFSHEHHRRVLAEFLDSIDERREPSNSGRSALHVQRLIDALLASGREGRRVSVAAS